LALADSSSSSSSSERFETEHPPESSLRIQENALEGHNDTVAGDWTGDSQDKLDCGDEGGAGRDADRGVTDIFGGLLAETPELA
jgi:hypothetical protein